MAIHNTTIVLGSGAWHTDFHTKPPLPFLEQAGYRVVACPMASVMSHGGWNDDVNAIESAVKAELNAGHNVCLAVHSLAGTPGLQAINNLLESGRYHSDKIVKLIFVASFVNSEERETITAHLGAQGFLREGEGSEEGLIFADNGKKAFFNDMSAEDAAPFIDALRGLAMYEMPELTSSKWQEIPKVYLYCAQDECVPPELQESIARKYGMEVVRIDASHDPFVSKPKEFAALVDKMLKS